MKPCLKRWMIWKIFLLIGGSFNLSLDVLAHACMHACIVHVCACMHVCMCVCVFSPRSLAPNASLQLRATARRLQNPVKALPPPQSPQALLCSSMPGESPSPLPVFIIQTLGITSSTLQDHYKVYRFSLWKVPGTYRALRSYLTWLLMYYPSRSKLAYA